MNRIDWGIGLGCGALTFSLTGSLPLAGIAATAAACFFTNHRNNQARLERFSADSVTIRTNTDMEAFLTLPAEALSRITQLTITPWEGEFTANTLPRGLDNLTRLCVAHFPNLDTIENLPSLTHLYAGHCPNLNTLMGLPSLTYLSVERCDSLTALRRSLQNLSGLYITACPSLTLPEDLLPQLTELTLEHWNGTDLPEGLRNLTSLWFQNCTFLTGLPLNLRNQSSIQDLKVVNCPHFNLNFAESTHDWEGCRIEASTHEDVRLAPTVRIKMAGDPLGFERDDVTYDRVISHGAWNELETIPTKSSTKTV